MTQRYTVLEDLGLESQGVQYATNTKNMDSQDQVVRKRTRTKTEISNEIVEEYRDDFVGLSN